MNKETLLKKNNKFFDSIQSTQHDDNDESVSNDYDISSKTNRGNVDFDEWLSDNSKKINTNIENVVAIKKAATAMPLDEILSQNIKHDVSPTIKQENNQNFVTTEDNAGNFQEEDFSENHENIPNNQNCVITQDNEGNFKYEDFSEKHEDITLSLDYEKWILSNNNANYDKFYKSKKEIVNKIFENEGELNFHTLKKELYEASVAINTRTETRNLSDINDKMQKIQMWRNRVCEIGVRTNNQYYPWKRFRELLIGLLARVEYDKPAIKQDGVVFIHLRDVEMYFADLEALHSNVFIVMKNLDSAYETLSRHLTLAMYEMESTKSKTIYNEKI
jgi:hypothetical protein